MVVAHQTRAYIILGAYAGLRVHEIARVRGEHFTDNGLAVIGKGGAQSTIPIHPEIANLRRQLPTFGYWFPSNSPRGHVHRASVSAAIARAFTRADVTATPHALRHYFGTEILNATGDLRLTQRAMRHASITSTQIYTLVGDDRLRAAIYALESCPQKTTRAMDVIHSRCEQAEA